MVEQVIQVCADVFHVSVENIKGRNRNRLFSDARRTAFALALEVYSNRNRVITFVDLAERVGKRDHSTVSYSVKTFHHLCKTDTEYNRKVLQCRTRLGLIKTGVFCKDCGNPVQHEILELCNDCYALKDANELEKGWERKRKASTSANGVLQYRSVKKSIVTRNTAFKAQIRARL